MNRDNVEKSLKRFLKRKISYSTALLVIFMITGGFTFPKEVAQPIPVIEEEADPVPIIVPAALTSSQFFFNLDWGHSGKRKSSGDEGKILITGRGFETDILENKKPESSGDSDRDSDYIDDKTMTSIPILPEFDPDFKVEIVIPVLSSVKIPEGVVPVSSVSPEIKAPKLNVPTATPPEVSVEIATPTTVDKVEVNKVTVAEVTEPGEKTVADVTVATPPNFIPSVITAPKTPVVPEVLTPDIPSFITQVYSHGNLPRNWVDYTGDKDSGYTGFIQMVAITGGNFNVKRSYDSNGNNMWNYSYKNYTGINTWPGNANSGLAKLDEVLQEDDKVKDETWNLSESDRPGTGNHNQLAFQKLIGDNLGSTMLSNATFLYTKTNNSSNPYLGEFVHLDIHGAGTVATQLGNDGSDGNKKSGLYLAVDGLPNADEIISAYKDAGENTTWNFTKGDKTYTIDGNSPRYAWINSGDITMEGSMLALTNYYDHYSYGGTATQNYLAKGMAINTGNITVQPYIYEENSVTKYQGSNNGVFVLGPSIKVRTGDNPLWSQHIMYNSGDIKTYTLNTVMFLGGANPEMKNSLAPITLRPLTIVNRNNLEMYGKNSVGIFFKRGGLSQTKNNQNQLNTYYFEMGSDNELIFKDENGNYKPLKLFGDRSIGLYDLSLNGQTKGDFAVDIGGEGEGNQTFTSTAGTTNGKVVTTLDINPTDTEEEASSLIENSFGIIGAGKLNLSSHQINIYDQTKNSVGVYAFGSVGREPQGDGDNLILDIGEGQIALRGGTNNVGILAYSYDGTTLEYDENTKKEVEVEVRRGQGGVVSTGEILLEGGTGNVGILAQGQDTKDIKVAKVTARPGTDTLANTQGMIVLYGKDGGKIDVGELNAVLVPSIDSNMENRNTGAALAVGSNTSIKLDRSNSLTVPNISIDGKGTYLGFGVMATEGGKVSAQNNYIYVKDGSTGAASLGEDGSGNASYVDLRGATIEFNGSGYTIYSDGVGKINIAGAKLILDGKAMAFDIDLKDGVASPITVSEEGKKAEIIVNSKDSVVFNLKNAGDLDTSTLIDEINKKIGDSFIALVNTKDSVTGFKLAGVDGGDIKDGGKLQVGNLDKSGTIEDLKETDPDKINTAKRDGYFYYNSFIAQGYVATIGGDTDKTIVQAVLDSSKAQDFNGQVAGFEMNSSSTAENNKKAAINLVNADIIADRTDSGTGAIGAFINFGLVDIDKDSSIQVEKNTANTVNAQGVGVYAVNGSSVTNAGNIQVDGEKAIGILGLAYRKDTAGNPVVDPFGVTSGGDNKGQGQIEILNKNNITMDGQGSIGIYADNNNTKKGSETARVTNEGTVTVGDSNSTASVGIYGSKAQVTNSGTIQVGKDGVALYGVAGSDIKKIGTLKLGSGAIGVRVDADSQISDTSSAVFETAGTIDKGGVGIYLKEKTTPAILALDIDGSNFEMGTNIYGENLDISYSKEMKVGKDGVGIYLNGTKDGIPTAENSGTITLATTTDGDTSVGIYGKSAKLINSGTIDLNGSGQTGIYAQGDKSVVINSGYLNLKDRSTGIYAHSGALAQVEGKFDDNASTRTQISFGGANSIGIRAENKGKIQLGDVTFSSANEKGNILAYVKDASIEILSGKTIAVDGQSLPSTSGNKTVAVYLDGTNSFTNDGGKIVVDNGAIGIYSKGDNTLKDLDITAKGQANQTTGIFIEGASTLDGKIALAGKTAKQGAIGVYGTGGVLTIGEKGLTISNEDMGDAGGKATGIYLADGASVSGGTINLVDSDSVQNIGIYYNGTGEKSSAITHGSDITLNGHKLIAIYADNGMKLLNEKDILGKETNENTVGSYVAGNSTLTSQGKIDLKAKSAVGIYTQSGKGINTGTITLAGDAENGSTPNIGMAAVSLSDQTAYIENQGTITLNGLNSLGMYIDGAGTSFGKNGGTIDATGEGETNTPGTGVYVLGGKAKFDGTGGKIKSSGVGIYLKNTAEGAVENTGTLEIIKDTDGNVGTGIFAESSVVDFSIDTSNTGATSLVAKGTTVVSGEIKAGTDAVGAYILDNDVKFSGEKSTAITTKGGENSIGVLFAEDVTLHTMDQNVSVDAGEGVGIFMAEGAGDKAMVLNHNGTVTTEGVGIYVAPEGTLNTGTSTINIAGDRALGIFIGKGAEANLGTDSSSGDLVFNFKGTNGVGAFTEGGTITLGNKIKIKGKGTLVETKNGTLLSPGDIDVTDGGTAFLGTYDKDATQGQKLSNSTGTIAVGNGGNGIVAVQGGSKPVNTVLIENDGTIDVRDSSIGIYTDVADVVSTGTITVGDSSVGIYSNENQIINSVTQSAMNITGTDAVGIYMEGATKGLKSTEISSSTSGNIGIFLDKVTGTIDAGTISLGDESIGILAVNKHPINEGDAVIIDSQIRVGNSSDIKNAIGVAVRDGAQVSVSETAKITVGKNGIGLYAEGANTHLTLSDAGTIAVGENGIQISDI